MRAVLEWLERVDFSLTEYDDAIMREIVEQIRIVDMQKISIWFLGGMEMRQNMRIRAGAFERWWLLYERTNFVIGIKCSEKYTFGGIFPKYIDI